MTMPSCSALFWSCRRKPDELLRRAAVLVRQNGFDHAEGKNLVERRLDPARDLYVDGRTVSIGDWRDAVEFAEHWDGMLVSFAGIGGLGLEILSKGPWAPHLMLHVPERLLSEQQRSAELATRWAGFLMDVCDACAATSCFYSATLSGISTCRWNEVCSGAAPRPSLSIEAGDGRPVPRGYRSIPLTSGATMVTSLPVKSSPHG